MKKIIIPLAGTLGVAVIATVALMRNTPAMVTDMMEKPSPQISKRSVFSTPTENHARLDEILTIENFHNRTNKFRAYFSDLCRSDPAEAARQILGVDAKFRDYDAVEEVARALAASDITAALEFADAIDSPRQADFIRMIALTEWGCKDPEAAANYVLANMESSQQGRALANFASLWGKQNSSDAMGFAARISDPLARASFHASVLEGWSAKRPAEAARAFSELGNDQVSRGALASIVARNWSEVSPEASARWASTLDENDTARGAALNPSIAKWTETDPTKASGFLSSLPRSLSRDEAVAVFVAGAVAVDPDSATQWAKDIDRQDIRRVAFQSAANHFAQRDPAQGQAWINTLGDLPTDWMQDLLRRINTDGSSQVQE